MNVSQHCFLTITSVLRLLGRCRVLMHHRSYTAPRRTSPNTVRGPERPVAWLLGAPGCAGHAKRRGFRSWVHTDGRTRAAFGTIVSDASCTWRCHSSRSLECSIGRRFIRIPAVRAEDACHDVVAGKRRVGRRAVGYRHIDLFFVHAALMDPQVASRVRHIQREAYLRLLRVVAAQPFTWVRSLTLWQSDEQHSAE